MTFREFAPVLYRALMMICRWLERQGLNKEMKPDRPEPPEAPRPQKIRRY